MVTRNLLKITVLVLLGAGGAGCSNPNVTQDSSATTIPKQEQRQDEIRRKAVILDNLPHKFDPKSETDHEKVPLVLFDLDQEKTKTFQVFFDRNSIQQVIAVESDGLEIKLEVVTKTDKDAEELTIYESVLPIEWKPSNSEEKTMLGLVTIALPLTLSPESEEAVQVRFITSSSDDTRKDLAPLSIPVQGIFADGSLKVSEPLKNNNSLSSRFAWNGRQTDVSFWQSYGDEIGEENASTPDVSIRLTVSIVPPPQDLRELAKHYSKDGRFVRSYSVEPYFSDAEPNLSPITEKTKGGIKAQLSESGTSSWFQNSTERRSSYLGKEQFTIVGFSDDQTIIHYSLRKSDSTFGDSILWSQKLNVPKSEPAVFVPFPPSVRKSLGRKIQPRNESVGEPKYHGVLVRAILDEDGKFRFED